MSGSQLPYHLRPNKAIERQLFIELLLKINRIRTLSDYVYIGFGGPFLEDFKLIPAYFDNKRMISLEIEPHTYQRQLFNKPLACIECLNMSSGDYIDSYSLKENAIIWLDYVEPKKLPDQLSEFQSLLEQIRHYDVVKITLNANPDSLGDKGTTPEAKKKHRFLVFKSRVGKLLPPEVDAQIDKEQFGQVLCGVLKNAAQTQIQTRKDSQNYIFQPLTAFVSSDGPHQMLTLTGILLDQNELKDFMDLTTIGQWTYAIKEWGPPIHVPTLTLREKRFIDQYLPHDIHNQMSFTFDPNPQKSLEMLENYIKYYRYYSYFSKIIV
ncbi:MAG: hypothetical protein DRR08_13990 [Candidatus Parabeggiatoa sp. nov. 2]|nr:MAG: hypothetical protein B6247_08090 [Beggiatoa sp. 4572_84]RKZ59412.1 MAG: hypothetical protein DRR08_13990 [Gammaproteobacteria bacterium]